MKKFLLVICASILFLSINAQSGNYPNDLKTAEETIKKVVFKDNFNHNITFAEGKNASISVLPNTEYRIFFVYNNEHHPAIKFKGYLMTPDKKLQEKFTAVPDDIVQTGLARIQRLKFTTKDLGGKANAPVKLEADPAATIYVFSKSIAQ